MGFYEDFPCSDPRNSRDDRVLYRLASKFGVAVADPSGYPSLEVMQRASEIAMGCVEADKTGTIRGAAEKLMIGDLATGQCIKNHANNICPFRCPNMLSEQN